MMVFLLVAVIPNTFTSTLLAPGLPSLAVLLGEGMEGVKRAQMLVTIPGVGMLCAPFVGLIADRIGSKRVLLFSLSIITGAGSGLLFTNEFAVLLMLRFVLGVGVGGLMAVVLSMIGDFYSGAARTKFLGYQNAIMTACVLVNMQVAAYLTVNYGWSSPFYAYFGCIPLIIFALLCIRTGENQMVSHESITTAGMSWLRTPIGLTFALAMIGNMFLAIVTYNVFTQLPFLVAEKGYSASTYANLMIPKLVCSVAFSFLFIYFSKILHPLAIISCSLMVSSISMFAFSIAVEPHHLYIAAIIGGPSTTMLEPAICSYLLGKMPPGSRALTMGGVFGTFHLGPFLIPFVFGGINRDDGFAASFQALSVAAGLAALVVIIGLRGRFLQKHHVKTIA